MGVGTIGWDKTHPLFKTNDIGPTHFYFSERRQSNPFHLSNYEINFEPIKMNVTFQETNENIN